MPMYHPMTFYTPTISRNFIHEALDGRAGAGETGALRRVSETAFFGVVGIAAHVARICM